MSSSVEVLQALDAQQRPASAARRSRANSRAVAHVGALVVFASLAAIVVVAQIRAGAYRAERVNYSDEAAHFMNGLVLRDYLKSGSLHPVQFASEYYLHYPKIAPLAWPPLFHVALGLFLLPGWAPHPAALALVAFIVAWAAWRLYHISRSISGRAAALVVCAFFVSTPIVIDMSSAVMADALVAACALEATYWLARFVTDGMWRHGAMFGLFAALACLTKGNGIAVLLMPPVLLLITRRFWLLRRPGLYIAAGIVLVLAGPFVWFSYRFDAAIGDFERVTRAVASARLGFYSTAFYREFGPLLAAFMCVGIAATVCRPRGRDWSLPNVFAASLTSLIAASLLFHLVNPHAALAYRYMSMAVAPSVGLIPVGASIFATLLPGSDRRHWTALTLSVILLVVFLQTKPAAALRQVTGWREVADYLETREGLAGRRILVVSDENGEGALVAEIAGRRPVPMATVIRGTKLLASDDWNGNNFRMTFPSAGDVMRELEDLHVDLLVFDRSARSGSLPCWSQVDRMIGEHASRLDEAYSSSGSVRPITVYRLRYRSPGPQKKLRVASSAGTVVTER